MGLDNAVISVGDGRVMVVTADPLSIIPSIGMERSAWLTVHELASDLTTSAVTPQFAVLDYNLPPSLSMDDFESLCQGGERRVRETRHLHRGRAHREISRRSGFSIVGGGMMMGLADERRLRHPKDDEGGGRSS